MVSGTTGSDSPEPGLEPEEGLALPGRLVEQRDVPGR